MPTGRMVPLVTVSGSFEAKVLAARLGSEGILWQLQGGEGPYPIGPVRVLVDESDLDLAHAVLEVVRADDEAYEREPGSTRAPLALWLVVGGVALMALVSVGKVIAANADSGPVAPSTTSISASP